MRGGVPATGSGVARSGECVEVRDRLTEYALSLLPPEELEPVERHVAWCAGCRKEAAELAAGAATVGLSAPEAEPPAGLEDRVVARFRRRTGSRRPARRPGRARSRALFVVAATLAVLMGLGWWATLGQLQTEKQARRASERTARDVGHRFHALVKQLLAPHPTHRGGQQTRSFQVTPVPGHAGGGYAMIYTAPHREDWVLVVLGGVPSRDFPYRVTLQGRGGRVLPAGELAHPDSPGGGGYLWRSYPLDLRAFTKVLVTDRRGHVVMSGTPEGRSPSPVP